MGQANYRIILTGNSLQGFDLTQVVHAAAELFKCNEDRARKFFIGTPTPLKREMDETTAQRYRERLTKAGIDCRIEAIAESSGLSLELEPTETPAKVATVDSAATSATATTNGGTGGLELVDSYRKASEQVAQTDTQFRCPKCNTPQDKGNECIQCGIIFSKYQPPAVNPEPVEEESETETNDEWDEIALFVGENMEQYQRKFRTLYNNEGKFALHWHWPAFLIAIPWLIFRKMYLWAVALYLIVLVCPWYLLFIVALLPGFFGNYLYYRHTISKINKITSNGEQRREDIIKAGGTNSIPITIGICFLAGLIMSIVMYELIVAPVMNQTMKQVSGDMTFIAKNDSPGTKATKTKMLIMKNALVFQTKVLAKKADFHMPTDMDELMQQMGNPPKGDQDYWGTSMTFQLDGDTLMFRSAGEDKTFNTQDDIELTANQ